jgi:nicotinate-nucleotide pyrophosphorylase (carboxylating)
MPFDIAHPEVVDAVRRALAEDVGAGDVTTHLCVPEDARATGRVVAREPMVVAGAELLSLLFDDADLRARSGATVGRDAVIAVVQGPARTLLSHERVALNFLQRLSGIATLARKYVDTVAGTRCKVLDTRKTTPGLRILEKMAAAAGGAVNHRMGLYDAVLIKNNHIIAAGGVREALERTAGSSLPVEIEVRTRAELDSALSGGARRLLLDNLSPRQAAEWIRYIGGRAEVELSGGITLETIRAYAETGTDYVSCGAITHSARAMDINFRLEMDTFNRAGAWR